MNETVLHPSKPPRAERFLRFLLRYVGSVSLLALVAVFMPGAWMDATHRALGMGPLPAGPVVGYLARSNSLLYAFLGGLLWVVSFDLHRHRAVIRYLGLAFLLFGLVMLGVDHLEGMQAFWARGEGPVVIAFGSLILGLSSRIPRPA